MARSQRVNRNHALLGEYVAAENTIVTTTNLNLNLTNQLSISTIISRPVISMTRTARSSTEISTTNSGVNPFPG